MVACPEYRSMLYLRTFIEATMTDYAPGGNRMPQTRIVIADDESLIRMNLRETLVGLGYLVVGEAGDGVSVINLARELRPERSGDGHQNAQTGWYPGSQSAD